MRWLLVAIIVLATTVSELLQAIAMRRHGEVNDFRPGALGRLVGVILRNRFILASIACSAISFFAFVKLVSIADLSFAVPATAGSFVLETILARFILREQVGFLRWTGVSLVACGVWLLSL